MTLRLVSLGVAAASVLALAACSEKPKTAEAPAAPAAAPAATALTLPVSLNGVMVALIDHSSDYIFDVGNGKVPKTDDDWREAEYHAYQMAVGGKAIQLAGTGPNDANWVAEADWKQRSDELSRIGVEAVTAAQAKNVKAYQAIGDKLVAVCEGCHTKYKPDIPSMGILHKPDFPHKAE